MPNLDLTSALGIRIANTDVSALRIGPHLLWEEQTSDPFLLAKYNFDETGNLFLDSSGNERHATIVAATHRTSVASKSSPSSARNNAVLAGGSSGVDITPYNSAGNRSIVFWAYEIASGIWLVRMQISSLDTGSFGVYIQNGVFKAKVRRGGATFLAEFAGYQGAGVWHHLAATYDGSTGELKLYVGGVLRSTVTVTGGGTPDAADFLDVSEGGGWGIDNLEIYSRVLTLAEIQAHMAA